MKCFGRGGPPVGPKGSFTAYPLFVIPILLLSVGGFVLAILALFAGSRKGQMEDYHILAVNMSNFGHDIVPTTTTKPSPTATRGGIGGFITSIVQSIESSIGDELNDIRNDIADRLAEELGISQFYSLHIQNSCEGVYSPNATSPGAGYNTTNCTAPSAGYQVNLTEKLDHELSIGRLHLSLSDLGWTKKITDAIDYLNKFLLAIFVLFVLGTGFSGLSFLLGIVALSAGNSSKCTRGGFIALTGLAMVALALGSAIATAVAKKGVKEINDQGKDIGISAYAGNKFMIISWVSFAVMFVAFAVSIASCCIGRKNDQKDRNSTGSRYSGGTADEKDVEEKKARNVGFFRLKRSKK